MRSFTRNGWRFSATLLGLILLCGCTGSRWARNHPDYAEKYPRHTGNLGRMTKQAVDARHVAGEAGGYIGVLGRDEPTAGGFNAGAFLYPEPFRGAVELRTGMQGLGTQEGESLSVGLEVGARIQSPTRLAPFVGVGGYVGLAPDEYARFDGDDNDFDGLFDEPDEEKIEGAAAIYPEIGVHFWATSRVRLTASASYYLTTIDQNNDFVMAGLSLAYLPHDNAEVHVRPVACSDSVESPTYNPTTYPSEPWPLAAGPQDETPAAGKASPYDGLPLP